jgi:nucleoside-diphosphate-sugar epimerase
LDDAGFAAIFHAVSTEIAAMRVLITGATGFIGGRLCAKLVQQGCNVRALVRDLARASELREHGVETMLGDLRDRASLERATADVDTIYHFAAVFRQEVPRKEIWRTNVDGIENLLDAAARSGVKRFIHCSSTSVYGLRPRTPTTEDSPFVPIRGDLYQASKLAAERHVLCYGSRGKLATTIIRITGVYGPGDLRFLKLFKAIARKRFVMIGRGEVLFSMIYIDDLLDGIVRCATKTSAMNSHYLLTGNEPITLNDTVRIIAEAIGVPPPRLHVPVMPLYYLGLLMEWTLKPLRISPPLFRRRVNFFRITRGFDNSKAKQELGWDPKIDLATGTRRTMDWYRSKGLL